MPDKKPGTGLAEREQLFDDLVQMTYATIAEPEKFHDLIGLWEDCLETHMLADDTDDGTDLAVHFNSALQIFDRIGRMQRDQDRAKKLLSAFSVPALICNADRRVLHSNTVLQDWLGGTDPIELLVDSDLGDQIAGWPEGQGIAFAHVPAEHPGGGEAAVITELPTSLRQGLELGAAYLVVFSQVSETSDVWRSIQSRYDLTDAETEVLVHLAKGRKADEIAEVRGVSINTIRAHIRGLLEKSGSRSQNDLVRSSVFLLSQFQSMTLVSRALLPGDPPSATPEARLILPSGRLLCYREYGTPRGRPVVYLHGMTGGPEMPESVRTGAAMRNIRLLSVSRAGFGKSDTIPATNMELVRISCSDLASFLDMLSIPRAVIIANLSAVGISLNFADLFPERCAGVINTGYCGLVTDELIEGMPSMTRSFARTYQRSLTATRFLTRAAIASVDFLGAERMMQRHLGASPFDLDYAHRNGIFGLMADGMRHAIAQGGDAFIKDGFLAVTDWHDLILRLGGKLPLYAMLGARDQITPHHRLGDAIYEMPGYEVTMFPDAGQLVLFQEWRAVMARIEACFASEPARLPRG